jgi:branched-chain amino acid transport system permease protein
LTEVIQQAFNAASSAAVYLLVAVGVSIVFGLSRVINIAYGDFMTCGSYVIFVIAVNGGLSFIYGFGVAAVGMAVVFIILERVLFRSQLARPVNGFLISLGLSDIIENALTAKYTQNPVSPKAASNALWVIHGVVIPADRVIIIVTSAVMVAALIVFLDHTRTGLAIRAIAHDREAAALMGAPVTRLVATVFAIGGLIAGAGGALFSLLEPVQPLLGAELILKGFIVALVGGLGSVRGAVIGAIALAITEAVIIGINLTSWLDVLEFGAVIALLLWRPSGLLGGVAHSM